MSKAVEMSSDTTVFCLITDGILSGSNAEIAANREFTIKNLPLLEDRIRDAAKKARNKKIDAAIYRLETSFTGKYFDYRNGIHVLSGQDRPYFIFVFGTEKNLAQIDERLRRENTFRPVNKLFTYNVNSVKTVSKGMLIKVPGVVNYSVQPAVSTISFSSDPNAPVDFKVRVCLKDLPEFYHDDDFLEDNLRFYYEDTSFGTIVDKTEFIQDVEEADKDLKTFDVLFQMDDAFIGTCPKSRTFRLVLDGTVDSWFREHSSHDDTDYIGDRTFALEYLIGGIIKGYDLVSMDKAVDLNVILKKQ